MENELPTIEELEAESVIAPVEERGSSLPLLLTLVALLIWFTFQTLQLVLERQNLSAVKANYEQAMQEAQKTQGQLQALITKTVELANQGNPGAKAVINELEKRGIPVQGMAPPPPSKAPPSK
jgi:hypothetical protein